MAANTIFLRLEGPLQAWGSNSSRLSVRRTDAFPSKSAIAGMICSALGVSRESASDLWLPEIASLRMGVRIDRPGVRWWDYHTVGAEMKVPIADFDVKKLDTDRGFVTETEARENINTKPGAVLSRREYLCDASFLVALQGTPDRLDLIWKALLEPHWQLFLGRKCCSPSRPITEHQPGVYSDLLSALASIPLSTPKDYELPDELEYWIEWQDQQAQVPDTAETVYDVPKSFAPHSYLPRFVVPYLLPIENLKNDHLGYTVPKWNPQRASAAYDKKEWKKIRAERLIMDNKLCVLCKSPATTVQHISYANAGGNEKPEELASLCRLCHDACTMLEYGSGMTTHRIDPCLPEWRERILAKREEIVRFRSQETKRRMLASSEEED